jgi:APA family basic amino acid/polyamine antiporter
VRGLGLLDSVLLLASGIIGSSIFLTAKDIAGPLPQPMLFLLVWVIGGVISLFGCVAFAELGSMFPDSGGQYVYLREAYGDLVAFLYGWMLFAVANGGSIAALSVASAAYTGQVFPLVSQEHVVLSLAGITITRAHVFALLLIAILTYVNVVGLRWGALLQNASTWTKFAAMGAFVFLGFAIGKGDWSHFRAHGVGITAGLHPMQLISAMGVALIAVFWAYDGWVYITWVAGEVKEPRRNVPLAMVLGVLVVGAIYMAMNVTYLYALPLGEIAQHETIAHAAAAALFSPNAAIWLSLTIAVSCFGAAATCTLSGARVYLAMAQDGVFFKRMAVIHPKWRTPAFSLIGQGIWAALLTVSGRYDLRHGALLHAHGDRNVSAALEAARSSASLSVHGISLAAGDLRASRRGVDSEYDYYAAHRSLLGHGDRFDWSAGIFILEAQQPENGGSGVADV